MAKPFLEYAGLFTQACVILNYMAALKNKRIDYKLAGLTN
jgi:hypothetical protein